MDIGERNIVLIGFMGCGKSLTSNKLAGVLNRKAVSTDLLIEQQEGKTVAQIFESAGEKHFRSLEKDIITKVSGLKGAIIDCGGGAVLNAQNVKNLKKNGVLFYLSASPDSIYKNIKSHAHRPLLNVDNPRAKIAELLESRKSYYEKADVTIDADFKTINQIARAIVKVLRNE